MSYDEPVNPFEGLNESTNDFRKIMALIAQRQLEQAAKEESRTARDVFLEILPMEQVLTLFDNPSLSGGQVQLGPFEIDELSIVGFTFLLAVSKIVEAFLPEVYRKSRGYFWIFLAMTIVFFLGPDLISQQGLSANFAFVPQGCEVSGRPLDFSQQIDPLTDEYVLREGLRVGTYAETQAASDIQRKQCFANYDTTGIWNEIMQHIGNFWLNVSASAQLQLQENFYRLDDSDLSQGQLSRIRQTRTISVTAFSNFIYKLIRVSNNTFSVGNPQTQADTLSLIAQAQTSESLSQYETGTFWALSMALAVTFSIALFNGVRGLSGPDVVAPIAAINQSQVARFEWLSDLYIQKPWTSWTTDNLKQLIAKFLAGRVADTNDWPNFTKISKEPAGLQKKKQHALFIDLRLNIERAAVPLQGRDANARNRLVQEFEAVIRQRLPTITELISPTGSIAAFQPVQFPPL